MKRKYGENAVFRCPSCKHEVAIEADLSELASLRCGDCDERMKRTEFASNSDRGAE